MKPKPAPTHIILAGTHEAAKAHAKAAGHTSWTGVSDGSNIVDFVLNDPDRPRVLVLLPCFAQHRNLELVLSRFAKIGFPEIPVVPDPQPAPAPPTAASVQSRYYQELIDKGVPDEVAQALLMHAVIQH